MDSVREKEEKKGKLLQWWEFLFCPNEKKEHSLLLSLLFFAYLCTKSCSIFSFFTQPFYYAFFSSTRFLEFVYTRPVRCCEL